MFTRHRQCMTNSGSLIALRNPESKRKITMKSFVKLLILVALANWLSTYAEAQYLSEIKYSITNQTSLISPTTIFTAGSTTGSYLICAYIEQPSTEALTVQLAWTDENGNSQTDAILSGSG